MKIEIVEAVRLIEPVHHGRECVKEGINNIYVIEKQFVFTENGLKIEVPFIKGAAFAGQLRDRMADSFIESSGIPNKEIPAHYGALLFSGGLLIKVNMKTSQLKTMSKLFPSAGVMGFSFGDLMAPSKVLIGNLYPVVNKNKFQIEDMLSVAKEKLGIVPQSFGAEEMVGRITRTRREDLEELIIKKEDGKSERRAGKDAVQNIWTMEVINPGVYLVGSMILANVDEIEAGCFFSGLKEFSLDERRKLGGVIKRGFGGITFDAYVTFKNERWEEPFATCRISLKNGIKKEVLSGEDVIEKCITAYEQHMKKNKQNLENLFASHPKIDDKLGRFLDGIKMK